MARDRIRVLISAPAGRSLQMYYVDPLSGREIRRSTGTMRRRDAERMAARWEDELRAGLQGGSLSWERFRERFEDEHLPGLKPQTAATYGHALDRFERDVGRPKAIAAITSSTFSEWRATLARSDLRPASVATYLRYVRSALAWAQRIGLVDRVPSVAMPSATGSRGRAISVLEFARFLVALKRGEASIEAGQALVHLAKGLWLSGLRLNEALRLQFESGPVHLDVTREVPLIHFAEQKSGKVESVPVTRDFARFVRRGEPRGSVFPIDMAGSTIGKRFSAAGKAAGIRVGDRKFVSAHDLRRTFGHRWALRVHPLVLKGLMRHASLETTLRYYVTLDAADLGDQLWSAVRGTVRGSGPENNRPADSRPKNPVKRKH